MPGAITVATNMAGRGVDIALGGNPEEMAKQELRKRGVDLEDPTYDEQLRKQTQEFAVDTERDRQRVLEAGGLYVLGTERHESRRIDNQLRGRSGRQGDPGESRFYLSLEDDLMRRFASDRVASIMSRLNIPPDVPIEAKMVSKSIERAQTQVESQNFEIRKNVLKYDEVMNTQREIIYKWRNQILHGDHTDELLAEWREDVVEDTVAEMTEAGQAFDWDWEAFEAQMAQIYPTKLGVGSFDHPEDLSHDEVVEAYIEEANAAYEAREAELTPEVMRRLERTVVLSVIDNKWREHLALMDYLRGGIGLRAMGQRDPLVEYQREGYSFFQELVGTTKEDSIRYMYHVEVAQREAQPRPQNVTTVVRQGRRHHASPGAARRRQDRSEWRLALAEAARSTSAVTGLRELSHSPPERYAHADGTRRTPVARRRPPVEARRCALVPRHRRQGGRAGRPARTGVCT